MSMVFHGYGFALILYVRFIIVGINWFYYICINLCCPNNYMPMH